MKRTIIRLSLITALMLFVLMPCFASAEDAGFDPQDPNLPAMDEPCGENGIPVLYLTVDPE